MKRVPLVAAAAFFAWTVAMVAPAQHADPSAAPPYDSTPTAEERAACERANPSGWFDRTTGSGLVHDRHGYDTRSVANSRADAIAVCLALAYAARPEVRNCPVHDPGCSYAETGSSSDASR